MFSRQFIQLLFAALFIGSVASAQSNHAEDALGRRIDSVLVALEQKGFAGSILIKFKEHLLLKKGYGFGDCALKKKSNPNMIYDIGSITKAVTAAAILKLVSEGRVGLEATAATYIPALVNDKREITILHLLLHASGLPDAFGLDEVYVPRDTVLDKINHAQLKFKAGTDRAYSNAGYSLLACVIEEVTKMRYEQFLEQHLFAPMGITSFGYVLPKWKKAQLVCGRRDGKAYGSTRDYFSNEEPSWYLVGNGGLLTNVDGLEAFFAALMERKLLPAELTDMMIENLTRQSRAGRLLLISGSNIVFTSVYANWLDRGVTLVLLTSNSDYPKEKVQPLVTQIITDYFNRQN